MNINPSKLVLFILILGLSTAFSNVSVKASTPTVFPAGNLAYVVEVGNSPRMENRKSSRSNSKQPVVRIHITRVDQIVRYQIEWLDKPKSEIWQDDALGYAIESGEENTNYYVNPGGPDSLSALAHLDENSLGWIDTNSLVGEVEFKNKKCLYYKKKMPVSDLDSSPRVYHAWIDKTTKLPVALDDGDALYALAFSKTIPTKPLIMPGPFRDELTRYVKALKKPGHL